MSKNKIVRSWKDPIYREKVADVTSPVGNVLDEVSEEELYIAGGDVDPQTALTYSTCHWISPAMGNDGHLCTATVECQPNCN
ncbi:plantaricin C family lantibiotic [Lentibacillus amyloliquefaciens]|uniref:Plantaricin C family lantibiotic n=1 Tax=Lentibacillus amyloliquefaciens TaxID=1472767 RepID=A0A0U3W6J3_9BACI|nr:plantaricin C family lantibiotic [Lentibacillus amyloliquefaciens]ALX48802.1 hypothetical protein AOX59_09350 [Lentibacillus amyloliquefaciens]